MVMFKAKFRAASAKPRAAGEPEPGERKPTVPPIEEERGPQAPVKLPGNPGAPERARALLLSHA